MQIKKQKSEKIEIKIVLNLTYTIKYEINKEECMKNTVIRAILLFVLIFVVLLLAPNISSAVASETATDEESLLSAIENVNDEGTIEIQNNITVTKPIVLQKKITIDGNGYTIAGSTEWTSTSGNQTMFTASSSNAKLTLKDIDLNNGPKYGVQSYDGATVILNNVSITGFRYGGVLVNGGKVEVVDLHLGYNGTGANNGIEIDKGAAVSNNPELVMNGNLTSDSKENVVRPAENGNLTEFTITNTENTNDKVVIAGDKVVVTDKNNNIISESFIPENVTPSIDEKRIVVTIIVGEETNKILVDEGATITEDLLKSHIKLENNYKIDGFFTDKEFKNKFDFSGKINEDITIYTKISKTEETKPEEINPEPEKDDVPKTGVESYIYVALFAMTIATAGIIYMKNKEK